MTQNIRNRKIIAKYSYKAETL